MGPIARLRGSRAICGWAWEEKAHEMSCYRATLGIADLWGRAEDVCLDARTRTRTRRVSGCGAADPATGTGRTRRGQRSGQSRGRALEGRSPGAAGLRAERRGEGVSAAAAVDLDHAATRRNAAMTEATIKRMGRHVRERIEAENETLRSENKIHHARIAELERTLTEIAALLLDLARTCREATLRSEERRVGKACSSGWVRAHGTRRRHGRHAAGAG